MNRRLGKGIALAGAALVVALVVARGGRRPPSFEETPAQEERLSLTRVAAVEPAPPAPPPPPSMLETARAWRARAASDPQVVARLGEWLEQPGRSPEVCELVAMVLGSLPDARGEAALRRAVGAGGAAPRWILLAALGMDRSGPADPLLARPDGPELVETPGGFRIRLRDRIDDPDLRQLLSGCLNDPDPKAREIARRLLSGSKN
jgi:hypothetical protein